MTSLGPGEALLRWQGQITACREARLESEDEAWRRAAEWYHDPPGSGRGQASLSAVQRPGRGWSAMRLRFVTRYLPEVSR